MLKINPALLLVRVDKKRRVNGFVGSRECSHAGEVLVKILSVTMLMKPDDLMMLQTVPRSEVLDIKRANSVPHEPSTSGFRIYEGFTAVDARLRECEFPPDGFH